MTKSSLYKILLGARLLAQTNFFTKILKKMKKPFLVHFCSFFHYFDRK